MSRETILSRAYFDRPVDDFPQDKTVDVLISKIRGRLPAGVAIETVWGRGWRMVVDPGGRG